jgi:diacylglycerol kinase (ATP)
MKYFVIVNPTSGRGLGEKSIPQIESNLRESGLDFTLVQTERMWHAAELAEGAARDGYDVIVCASGDGTVNEAINGIMSAKKAGFNGTAFTVLGIGTGNDFAGGTGIPTNLNDGLKALKGNKRKKIDIGFVKGGDYPEGRYFGNGIGVGFDAAVGNEAVKVRWTRGLPAYLIGVIKTVFLYYNPAQVEIVLDDNEVITTAFADDLGDERPAHGRRFSNGARLPARRRHVRPVHRRDGLQGAHPANDPLLHQRDTGGAP